MNAASTGRVLAGFGLACAVVVGLGSSMGDPSRAPRPDGARRTPTAEELQPSVEAAFQSESYAPGESGSLRLFNDVPQVELQIFHAGPEHTRTVGRNEMRGVPVTRRASIGASTTGRVVRVAIGTWPSGLYFARLDAADGRVGFAPFVVRPRRLGEHRVAVVMPTFTWQAYNIRDDDGDGVGDSWYADWDHHFARLYRPFLNRGVPYNFKSYDLRFLQWLDRRHKQVDFLADSDLDGVRSAAALARDYHLIVFPGHHEYVTSHEYGVVEGFRDRGGSLAFLSADNFFWRVVRHGAELERTQEWRDLGRPEAALIGVQYTMSERFFGQYVVQKGVRAEPWLFAGTGYRRGSVFGRGGIEIDAVGPSSPKDVRVLARIPDLSGSGRNADMTVYRTNSGGTVFAAGSFTLAGSALDPDISRILENLWAHLAGGA